jgi:transcriptional regulator with XRE-family HTH domain
MARRLGCTTDLLGQWENGAKVPESETLNQLRYLRNHADMTSIQTQRQPAIEVEIEIRRVSQLTHRDLFGG